MEEAMYSKKNVASANGTVSRASRLVWVVFLLLCAIAAAAAVRRIVVLIVPPVIERAPRFAALDMAFASRKILTLCHIVPALLFVLLLPAWFSRRVRHRVHAHRTITYALFFLGTII